MNAVEGPQGTLGREGPPAAMPERVFAYLDGELTPPQRAAFEADVARDPALAASLSGGQALFDALNALEELSPAPDFAVRAMARLHLRPSLWGRLWGWAAGTGPATVRNPLAALVDGDLPRRQAGAIAAFTASNPEAAAALAGWKSLHERLDRLPALAPGANLPLRVMARLPVAHAHALPRRSRTVAFLAERAHKLLPRPQERLAAASGAAFGPAVVVASLLWVVFRNPLVTMSDVAGFVAAKAGAAATGIASAFFSALGTGTAQGAWEAESWGSGAWGFWREATASVPAVATGLAAFAALSVAAGWVLYRNARVSAMETRYAPA